MSETLKIPEGHVFPRNAEGSYSLAGWFACLVEARATQFTEINALAKFHDDTAVEAVATNPHVVTRIWLFESISRYVSEGDAYWATQM